MNFPIFHQKILGLKLKVRRGKFLIFLVLFLGHPIVGCKIDNRIGQVIDEIKLTRDLTLASLDEAITAIENAPAEWENVLDNLIDDLTSEIQETIREDVQLVINQSIGALGTQVICIMDAIPGRIIRSLEMIRANLIGGEISPLPPTICLTSINTIDLNQSISKRSEVIFYGYDFVDRVAFSFYFIESDGTKTYIDYVAFQSNYQFTVDLSSFSDQTLSEYKSLAVAYQNEEISRIIIQQKAQSVPRVRTVYITPPTFSYIPPHTRGDQEFHGNGPFVRISNYFYNNSRQAYLIIYMIAEETKSDWTTAEGYSNRFYFYTAPVGWHIKKIDGETSYPGIVQYTDTDIHDDLFNKTLGHFRVVGDTQGNDAGENTGVTINYTYRVPIIIEED